MSSAWDQIAGVSPCLSTKDAGPILTKRSGETVPAWSISTPEQAQDPSHRNS
jgi:hypothetical protein